MDHRTSQSASAPIGQHKAESASANFRATVRLLRAIAGGTDAKDAKHDVIFLEAARLIESLEADLLECQEYFADHMDVLDGDYGEPHPNREMQLHSMIDETLNGAPV